MKAQKMCTGRTQTLSDLKLKFSCTWSEMGSRTIKYTTGVKGDVCKPLIYLSEVVSAFHKVFYA